MIVAFVKENIIVGTAVGLKEHVEKIGIPGTISIEIPKHISTKLEDNEDSLEMDHLEVIGGEVVVKDSKEISKIEKDKLSQRLVSKDNIEKVQKKPDNIIEDLQSQIDDLKTLLDDKGNIK